jgi:hypothetical protein
VPKVKTGNRRSLGNLQPAKPGEVRNPTGANGATKRRAQLQEICQRVLGKQVDVSKAGKVYKVSGIEAICEAMRNEAIKGDVGAATWCRDTAYGKPVTMIGDPDGNPLAVAIHYSGVVPPSKQAGESLSAQEEDARYE